MLLGDTSQVTRIVGYVGPHSLSYTLCLHYTLINTSLTLYTNTTLCSNISDGKNRRKSILTAIIIKVAKAMYFATAMIS